MVTVVLQGGKALQAKLNSMEKKVAKSIVRKAVRASQKILLDKAKSNALSMVGGRMGSIIGKSLALRVAKRRQRSSYSMQVLLKQNADFFRRTKAGMTHYIPAAIEYGHGRNKEQAARPYMRSAAESTRDRVMTTFSQELRKGIEQVARSG